MVIYNLKLVVQTKPCGYFRDGTYISSEPVRSLSSQFTSFKRLYSLLVEEYKLAKLSDYQIKTRINTVRV